MNKSLFRINILSLILFVFGCGEKGNPTPDQESSITTGMPEVRIVQDTVDIILPEQFFQLEQSIEDIQKDIKELHTQVMEYEYKPPALNYSEKLKAIIDKQPAAHKIIVKNGSVIEGTIIKDNIDFIIVNTDLGQLTIAKEDIEKIENFILPVPEVDFIGHGKEEIYDTYRQFTGKVINHGKRRGDFVRVIYYIWGENTELISSDSTFIDGSQIIYQSGITTDTVLEPDQTAEFSIKIKIDKSAPVAYVTREVRWDLYD